MAFYKRTLGGKIRGRIGGGLSLTYSPPPIVIDPDPVVPVPAAVLFTTSVENADTVASWTDQEMSVGQYFAKGDVPAGNRVRALVGTTAIPCQLSERIFWSDGSLKHAFVRMLVPTIPAGGSVTITWQRVSGGWNDAVLHTDTSCITSKVTLELALTSFKGRTTANVLTVERGPLLLNSNVMLSSNNSPWVDKVMSGPLCNEWRVSDMARVGTTAGSPHANLGGYLYVRAWGGTATSPKRIQFLFRTIYGWTTDVTTDEQGIQVNMDLKVNGSVVRGNAIGTAGWGSIKSWKGGFLHSADTDGLMDWYDVDTGSFVHPPKIVYRHNITYGITSKFVPPLDVNNSAIPLSQTPTTCLPGKRGPLRPKQDDVADAGMITWIVSQPVGNAVGVHARGTAAQIINHMTTVRAAGWGMGAMSGVGLHRTTRKITSYLPPTKQTNLATMGASIYGTGRPANVGSGYNSEITGLDSAHFPQMAFWPALLDGDQHWLDMMYQEVVLAGVFESDDYGFKGTTSRTGIVFGGISWYGQIRAVSHNPRPMVCAMGLGRPSDPHYTMASDYFTHWTEMTREVPFTEDAWRGGLNRTDGRRFQDLKLIKPNNPPTYKIWMHSFGVHNLSYGYGISENPDVKERADWWAHAPTVMAGGWHNDPDPTMKPDPYECMHYSNIAMDRDYSPTELRRYYLYGQWRYEFKSITYKADGQTVDVPTVIGGAILDGMIITPAGLRSGAEPNDITDQTKFPASGLTAALPYYAVQSSGTTCKLSLTLGGTPVTFVTNATTPADITGSCNVSPVAGWHPSTAFAKAIWLGTGGADYPVQVGAALAFYQWYCAPNDLRVAHARNNIHYLKSNSNAPTTFDPRGANIVPRIPTWRYTSGLGGYIDVTSATVMKMFHPGGSTATSVRCEFTTVIGQNYTFKFTSDVTVERRIGTSEDGAQVLAAASVSGSVSYPFTATAARTWVYLAKNSAGTANLTGISFASTATSDFSAEFSEEFGALV